MGAAPRLPAQGQMPRTAPRTIVGVVTDTMGFTMDAEVYIPSLKVKASSGADGQFRFNDVRPGRYTVQARRIGYFPQEKRVVVTDTGGVGLFALVPLRFSLPPVVTAAARGGLSGVVGDTSFHPIPGAQVEIVSTVRYATTDSAGEFFIDVPPGKYMVRVKHKKYGSQLASVTVPADSGRRMSVWLSGQPTTKAEEFAIQELHQRIAFGGLNCAASNGRTDCTYRPSLLTHEDIAKLGFKDLQPIASAGNYQYVPESCEVTIAGKKRTTTVWMLSAAEIEFLEIYTPRREAYTVGSGGKVNGGDPLGLAQCPTIIAWLRK